MTDAPLSAATGTGQAGRPMTPAEVLAAREAETLDEHPDPAFAALQKCKPAAHLRIIAERHTPVPMTARFVPVLACRNPKEGPPAPTWGALLVPGIGKAQGMQLYPDAVALLVAQLPIVAAEVGRFGAGWAVSVQHTVQTVLMTWQAISTGDATTIAAALAGMHA